jgi:hypothetical protein
MGALEVDALGDEVAVPDCVLHRQVEVREASRNPARNRVHASESSGAGSRLAGAWAM